MPNEIIPSSFPKPAQRTRGGAKNTRTEAKKIGIEMGAMAYVMMENGLYKFSDGANKPHSPSTVNKAEVMRRAGYSENSLHAFDRLLGENEHFWELVELYRIRLTDPMFRQDQTDNLWKTISDKALQELYERLFYYPHEMSTDMIVKVIKTVIDAGITTGNMDNGKDDRLNRLLDNVDESKRGKIISDMKKDLSHKVDKLDALEKAHRAADAEQ